jgi:FkbM family methyltransferase
MVFEETYGTTYCIPAWLRDEQIRIAIRKVADRVTPIEEIRSEPIAVVGFGPSLQETWEEIKQYPYVMTCSGAHPFLLSKGIIPNWHVAVDPLPKNTVQLIGPPHPDVEYLISSTTHPDVLDHLKDNKVKLWHVFSKEEDSIRVLPPGEWAFTGGADAGLRSLVLARAMGFTNIHVFGIDGSGKPTQSHAGAHPSPPGKLFPLEFPEGSGHIWYTTPALLACAKTVPHEVDQLKGAVVTFHGQGLVQAIMKAHTPNPPRTVDLALLRPDLITPGYRALNQALHESNPAYGTSGTKYVETILKLSKALNTTSILDYGCGKGLLGKGLPFPIWEYDPAIEGKEESPRPADLVVCTDVLEHIEPTMLNSVLLDIARCLRKVGYFVIHTGAANKTLADGRNAHLIQKDKAWWGKKLAKHFDIGKVIEEGPQLQIVVGPKVPELQKDLTPVTYEDTSVTFYTPNDTTKWRANTLFTKEPITIQWIDMMRAGNVLWDIGANVGGYSIWAAQRRGVEVYAFEPEASNYAVLCRNFRENHVKGLAYPIALSDAPRVSTLFCSSPQAGGSCHSLGEEVGPNLEARPGVKQGAIAMTLDQLSELLPRPTHLKIDVDGFEHLVIAGGKGLLQQDISLLVEVNENLPAHQAMLAQLAEWGYTYDEAQVDRARRADGPFKGCAEYVFSKVSVVEQTVLDAIERAEIIPTPFPHCVVAQVFPPEVYAAILESLPPDSEYDTLELSRGIKGYPERFTHPAPTSLNWMTQGRLRAALDKKFGVTSTKDETLLLRDHPGYTIKPHTDTTSKAVTMLTFLGDSQHGTSLYTPKESGYSDSKGVHHDRALFDEVAQVSGAPNTAFIFARTDTSFHGTEPYEGVGPRDLLLYDSRTHGQ